MIHSVEDRLKRLLEEVPREVTVIAASKTRSPEEIEAAAEAGISIFGENYVQEAEKKILALGGAGSIKNVQWHLIGHLQKNKISKAVKLFDMIQSIDDEETAGLISRRCAMIGKVMPVLIEVNSASEDNKSGVLPEKVQELAEKISRLDGISLQGLMTMGPMTHDPENMRPYFRITRRLFDSLLEMNMPGTQIRHLSMGMTDSYRIAIEEGSNMLRVGTLIFGERPKRES